ncbi:MAG TPA: hypothetical protein VK179_09740 [Bacteroidales bacterium]|nr:hypothetical protein [Bacteroidales bacterium]
MNIVQVQNITVDELIERIVEITGLKNSSDNNSKSVISNIVVLSRKDAARSLNISTSLFDKLSNMGLIPQTVILGYNKQGEKIMRWAEHHIIKIKPIIQELRFNQNLEVYSNARKKVQSLLQL